MDSAQIDVGAWDSVPVTGRYFAYLISALPLFLGYIWIALDARRQGWHDKLVDTVVVAPKEVEQKAVIFEDS